MERIGLDRHTRERQRASNADDGTSTDRRLALVRPRTRSIARATALGRRDGVRGPTSARAWVPTRIAERDRSPALPTARAPRCAGFAPRTAHIVVAHDRLALVAARAPIAARLATAPGVGPVPASAFVATLDDRTRLHSAHAREASLGVVPSERSAGETRQRGRITTAGTGRMRRLLVDCVPILGSTNAMLGIALGPMHGLTRETV